MIIKIKKLHPNAVIPKQASEFAGGWDVVATEIIQEANDFVICKLGFAIKVPINHKLTIVPRSSLTKTMWVLQNSPALIDADFTGQIELRFRAMPFSDDFAYSKFPYKINDRVAQCYLEEVIPIEFEVVEELSTTIRGDGGFGSTDKPKLGFTPGWEDGVFIGFD
jgi:dUTP pyrophosphatase